MKKSIVDWSSSKRLVPLKYVLMILVLVHAYGKNLVEKKIILCIV